MKTKLQKYLYRNRFNISRFFLLIVLIAISTIVFSRAGGAGGSNGGSGGGDGGIVEIVIYLFMMLPFPWNFVAVGVIIVLFYLSRRKAKQQSVLNKLPTGQAKQKPRGMEKFRRNNPGFNEAAFKEKVKKAFVQIQEAWEKQDLSKVRKYISDGVYQRFNTQFKMMALLDQKNTIDKLWIKNIYIDKAESDGLFDIVHVAIHASIVDRFISGKYPQFNSGGKEEFVEYWSFIKKRGTETKDMYHTDNCPNCGGQLPANAGEVSKCPYCNTITNLGDYDWVLSEITQADDYINTNPRVTKGSNLSEKVRAIMNNDPDFSIQAVEDKASNGYLQIQTAMVTKDPKIMRRFVSDELYQKISANIPSEQIVYNRLFLNDVTLIGARQENNKHVLMIAVKSSYQRVIPKERRAIAVDNAIISKTEVIYMERDINASKAEGSLYAHDCPSCGAPIKDTTDLKCSYCGALVNSTSHEWIIRDIVDTYTHRSLLKQDKANTIGSVDTDKLDSLYGVRDFAFNNVLIMIAADGIFDSNEQQFAQKIAKRWGYSPKKLKPMFDMAKNGKLVIRMPNDTKQQKKIFKLMQKAAKADHNVCHEEQSLLDNIQQHYNIAV